MGVLQEEQVTSLWCISPCWPPWRWNTAPNPRAIPIHQQSHNSGFGLRHLKCLTHSSRSIHLNWFSIPGPTTEAGPSHWHTYTHQTPRSTETLLISHVAKQQASTSAKCFSKQRHWWLPCAGHGVESSSVFYWRCGGIATKVKSARCCCVVNCNHRVGNGQKVSVFYERG